MGSCVLKTMCTLENLVFMASGFLEYFLDRQFGKNSFNSSKAPSSTSMGPGRKGGKVGDIRSTLSSRNGGHGLDSLDSEQANGGLSLSASKNSWMMTPKTSNKNLEE